MASNRCILRRYRQNTLDAKHIDGRIADVEESGNQTIPVLLHILPNFTQHLFDGLDTVAVCFESELDFRVLRPKVLHRRRRGGLHLHRREVVFQRHLQMHRNQIRDKDIVHFHGFFSPVDFRSQSIVLRFVALDLFVVTFRRSRKLFQDGQIRGFFPAVI